MKNTKVFICLAFALIYFSPKESHGQESESPRPSHRPAQYVLGREDEVMIKVNVLGYVQSPGQYLVPRHTDLLSLITLASGMRKGADLSNVRIMRATNLTNGTNDHSVLSTKHEIIYVNLHNYFQTGEIRYIPILEADDSVLIQQSFGSKMGEFLGVNSLVGLIAIITTVIFVIDRVNY